MPLSDLCQQCSSASGSEATGSDLEALNSDDGRSSESSSSTSSSVPSPVRKLARRQKQTLNARKARIRNATARRLSKHAVINPPPHRAEMYQSDLHGSSDINKPGVKQLLWRFRRIRLLVSYLKAWCQAVASFFCQHEVSHVVLTAVVDDTNIRVAEVPSSTVPTWRLSRVTAVMNCCQQLLVSFREKPGQGDNTGQDVNDNDNDTGWSLKFFTVQTPMIALPKSDRDTLSVHLMGRLLFFLGKVSRAYQSMGLPADLSLQARLQGVILVFDSLKTNIAMMKQFREVVHQHHNEDVAVKGNNFHPMLPVCCLLHQLALARQPMLLGLSGYWSTVVRLSHLFESNSFRNNFRVSLLRVLCKNFIYIPVAEMPNESCEWRAERVRMYRYTHESSKRIQLHNSLSKFDNGNPTVPSLVHYCQGHCCRGDCQTDKENYALAQICKLYMLLFSYGFPVPLTYRWVHAQRALQYMKEIWDWMIMSDFKLFVVCCGKVQIHFGF